LFLALSRCFSLLLLESLQPRLGLEDRCELHRSIVKLLPYSASFRLKRFDESTVVSRMGSQAATPPLSVKGIGNKGSDISDSSDHFALSLIFRFPVAKPDYSESKIVLAMVTPHPHHHTCANFTKSSC
jgi:hypothetical protein